jgi:isoaspartyl peptidase/L-asparaginase-like protein (Ntn-hydrolase superfamily)
MKIRPTPAVISTWKHGLAANEAAWKVLAAGGRALDAVEQGARVSELDPAVTNVGYGGLPDRDGEVTLDACIMDEFGNAGSVVFLRHIKNPISVARLVMEQTPHVMLAGEGALHFALAHGFKKENLLTSAAKAAWKKWRKENSKTPSKIDEKNHDTIGLLAIDIHGNISGACTTSGTAWKLPGRVGDSPIIGAGLFVDNEIGGAAATGHGEAVMKIAGAMVVVEAMRHGLTPLAACEEAVRRIAKNERDLKNCQVGFIALNKQGVIGAYSVKRGFEYAWCKGGKNKLFPAKYFLKK